MSVRFLAPPLGILIGAGGGALIAQHYGWRVALLSAAAPGLILALLLSLFISEPKRGAHDAVGDSEDVPSIRSEEHTSELQSLMRISYAVFCLKKKKHHTQTTTVQYK